MKHFIPASIIASLLAFNPLQAQYDIEATVMSMSSKIDGLQFHVPAGFAAPVVYLITNVGDTLRTNQKITVSLTDNGVEFYKDSSIITGDIAPDSMLLFHTNMFYTMEEVVPNHQICIDITLDSAEADVNNNTFCNVFQIKQSIEIPIDWSVDSMKMFGPSFEKPWDIYNYEKPVPRNPDSIRVYFTNNSDITYTPYHNFRMFPFRGSVKFENNFTLTGIVAPGQVDSVTLMNPQIIPDLPKNPGTYPFCVYGKFQQDSDTLNDTTCMTIQIIDTFDWENHDNWPVGTNNISDKTPTIYYSLGAITVKNFDPSAVCRISDITGRTILEKSLSSGSPISFDEAAPGIYLVQILGQGKLLKAQKIVVPN